MTLIIPSIGTAAKYSFADAFSALDGIYIIRIITNFSTAKENAYPIVDMYTAVGLTDDDYASAWTSFVSDRVLQLESIVDSSVTYYVPESIIRGVPDVNIVAAHTVSLRVNIGQWTTTDLISVAAVKSEVDDIISSLTGTTKQTSIHTANTAYMTQSDYNNIVTSRTERQRTVDSLKRKLIAANNEIARLSTKIDAYEDIIASIATSSGN